MLDAIGTIYVVHCRRLEERRRALEPRLAELARPTRWILDFDPDAISRAARRRVARRARLRPQELSVYLKHEVVFRTIADGRDDLAFVLEDDAVLPPDFGPVLGRHLRALSPTAGLAYLGESCGLAVQPAEAGGMFGPEIGTRSMSAVLVRPDAARIVSAELARRPIAQPIDLTLNQIIRDRAIPVVWSVPALVPNGSETGRFRHSLGVGWRGAGWLERLRHALS